jgi:hypothetical protein
MISLNEYMMKNKKIRAFLNQLAEIENSEISDIKPESYIKQLKWLKIETIGQLQNMLERNRDLAFRIAKKVLEGTELDILSSNTALRFLCQAELITNEYTHKQVVEFISLTVSNEERAERQANNLFRTYDIIKAQQ